MRSVRDAIADAADLLKEVGIDTPRVDAELLAAAALGIPRSRLAAAREFDPAAGERFHDMVQDRAKRRPLQHIVGTAPFRLAELAVGPGVFIPRPETELLVDWGLARLHGRPAPVVVDLCSGTGAIALAIAQEHPGARVYAVEDSPDALPWLEANVGAKATIVAKDATDAATLAERDGEVDLVLCNP